MAEYEAGRCVLPHTREPDRTRPANVGFLCIGHAKALEEALQQVAVLWDAAEEGMVRSSGSGPKISGTKDKPLPIDPKLSTARLMLRDRLASWASLIAEEHPDGLHPPRFGADPCSTFLLRWHDWICEQMWVDDYHREILEAVNGLRAALDPVHVRKVDLGPCDATVACDTATHAEITCQGIMRAVVTTSDDDLPAEIGCTACGLVKQPQEWRTLSRRLRGGLDPMLTAAQLSQLFRVPVGTLQRWAHEDDWRRDDGRPKRYHSDDAQHSYDQHQPQQQAS